VSVFCPDAAVVARCSAMLPWLAALVAIDGLNAACSGILRGCGRQKLGAAVNVAGYWILGLPTAAALAFGAGMGERGLWCGLTAGAGFQAVVLLFLLARWDWQREASRVSKLAAAAA
jgi:MATE family multidrug resistance protein